MESRHGDGHTWLLIDGNYICHRAFHSTGHLSHGGEPTGIAFGFFRTILELRETHQTDRFAFCFDHGPSKRIKDYPNYKWKRRDVTRDEKKVGEEIRKQIDRIKDALLPELGCKNIFQQYGYEADDCIASITENSLSDDNLVIIVSSDHDYYQLLRPGVICWDPNKKRSVSAGSFQKDYGIGPARWVVVKAIAGCHSDNVVGVPGVGEITAIKYLSGRLKPSLKSFQAIEANKDLWQRNLRLVGLPYPGVNKFELQEDHPDPKNWRAVMTRLGMNSLMERRSW